MKRQSSLGTPSVSRVPSYQQTKMGRVVGVGNYKQYGKIEVVFLDYGAPCPVWVVSDLDREPQEGDMVLVGYMEGRKDAPYLVGFVRNQSYTSNMVVVGKDYIRLQFPASEADKEGNMLDDSLKAQRPYIELTPTKTTINQPNGSIELKASGSITANGEDLRYDNI